MSDRLFAPPPDRLTQEEAMAFVRPFSENLSSAVRAALALYGKDVSGRVRSDVFDFAEGGVIYSLVAKSLERALRELSGIRYELHEKSVRIFAGSHEEIVMRIAKTNWERLVGRVSNDREKLRDAYYFLRKVKGIQSTSFRLTLGYVPNTVTWEPASVFVSRQVGHDVLWYEDLLPTSADSAQPPGLPTVPLTEPDLRLKDDAVRESEPSPQQAESQGRDES